MVRYLLSNDLLLDTPYGEEIKVNKNLMSIDKDELPDNESEYKDYKEVLTREDVFLAKICKKIDDYYKKDKGEEMRLEHWVKKDSQFEILGKGLSKNLNQYLEEGSMHDDLKKQFDRNNFKFGKEPKLTKEEGKWWVKENGERKHLIEKDDKKEIDNKGKLKIFNAPKRAFKVNTMVKGKIWEIENCVFIESNSNKKRGITRRSLSILDIGENDKIDIKTAKGLDYWYVIFKELWKNAQKGDVISKNYIKPTKNFEDSSTVNRNLKRLCQVGLLGGYRHDPRARNSPIRCTMGLSEDRRNKHIELTKKMSEKFEVVSRAAGSISLIGSHAVTQGQSALWLPVPLYLFVGIKEDERSKFGVEWNEIKDLDKSSYETALGKEIGGGEKCERRICLYSETLEHAKRQEIAKLLRGEFDLSKDAPGLECYIISEIYPGGGLGSSGALATALSMAIHYLYFGKSNRVRKENLSKETIQTDLFTLSSKYESDFQDGKISPEINNAFHDCDIQLYESLISFDSKLGKDDLKEGKIDHNHKLKKVFDDKKLNLESDAKLREDKKGRCWIEIDDEKKQYYLDFDERVIYRVNVEFSNIDEKGVWKFKKKDEKRLQLDLDKDLEEELENAYDISETKRVKNELKKENIHIENNAKISSVNDGWWLEREGEKKYKIEKCADELKMYKTSEYRIEKTDEKYLFSVDARLFNKFNKVCRGEIGEEDWLREQFKEEYEYLEEDAKLEEEVPKKCLFSLSRKNYMNFLHEGTIDSNLVEAFEEKGYYVEDDQELLESDGEWFISGDKKRGYKIEVNERNLNIYPEKKWRITVNGEERYKIERKKDEVKIYGKELKVYNYNFPDSLEEVAKDLTIIETYFSPWLEESFNGTSNLADKNAIPSKMFDKMDEIKGINPGGLFNSIRTFAWKIENIIHGIASGAAIHASLIGSPGYPLLYTPLHYKFGGDDSCPHPQQGGKSDYSKIEGVKRPENSEMPKGWALVRSVQQIIEDTGKINPDVIEDFLFDKNSISLVGCGERTETKTKQKERDNELKSLYKNHGEILPNIITPLIDENGNLKEYVKNCLKEDRIQAPLASLIKAEDRGIKANDKGNYFIDKYYKGIGGFALDLLGEIIRVEREGETSHHFDKTDQVINLFNLAHQLLSTLGITSYKLNLRADYIRSESDLGTVMVGGGGKTLLTFGPSNLMQENVHQDPKGNLRMFGDQIFWTSLYDTPFVYPATLIAAEGLAQKKVKNKLWKYTKSE